MEPSNHSQHPRHRHPNGEPLRDPAPAAPDEGVLTVQAVAIELQGDMPSVHRPKTAGYHENHLEPESEDIQHVSTEFKPGTGRRLGIAAVILLLVLAVGFAITFAILQRHNHLITQVTTDAADAPPAVDVVDVKPSGKTYPISLPGETAGWYQSVIYSRVDGYIGKWMADIGDRVKKGEILATIETPELDQQLNAAKAKVQAAEQQTKVADTNVSFAKITYDRWWGSPGAPVEPGVVSKQEQEEKKAAYQSALAQLAAAKAQQTLDQADVDRLQAMESFKTVIAPYDGVITHRYIDIHDLVTAGSTNNTSPLYDIAQATTIRVFVDVPQRAAADMVKGLPAEMTSDQFPGRVFRGTVARTAMSINPQSRTERTEVDIPNPDLALVPGMYVDVTFELKQSGLLEVPASALLAGRDGLAVAVVTPDGKVNIRRVTIAKDDGQTVELASGVAPHDRVALNLSSEVTNGQKVDAVTIEDTPATLPQPPPILKTSGAGGHAIVPPTAAHLGISDAAPLRAAPTTRPATKAQAVPAGAGSAKEPAAVPTVPPSKAALKRPGSAIGGSATE